MHRLHLRESQPCWASHRVCNKSWIDSDGTIHLINLIALFSSKSGSRLEIVWLRCNLTVIAHTSRELVGANKGGVNDRGGKAAGRMLQMKHSFLPALSADGCREADSRNVVLTPSCICQYLPQLTAINIICHGSPWSCCSARTLLLTHQRRLACEALSLVAWTCFTAVVWVKVWTIFTWLAWLWQPPVDEHGPHYHLEAAN